MPSLPLPLRPPEPIIEPEDVDYPGIIRLNVDATDTVRRIFNVRQMIPVDGDGTLTLLYPKWLPGYHSPQAPIELFGGLVITVGGERLAWRRHETEVNAFLVKVPYGETAIEASFQFLSPTAASQGAVVVSPNLLFLHWNAVVLYPAGHFARRIVVEPSVRLPSDWKMACALEVTGEEQGVFRFAPTALDVLIDSPMVAGRHFRKINLDTTDTVAMNIVADAPELLQATDEQVEPHREMVRQADLLFGSRHFDRFDILLALTDDLASNGVEHHQSCEAITLPGYFNEWNKNFVRRDTIPHEYVHSWNGKYRRGVDSWTPCFHQPIRNTLMWVYEGQTQYWDRVLCARSGLWTKAQARQALAEIAATHHARSGSRWRPMSDTTRDPIIAERNPLPWPSWQRSEDYYTEGALVWLDVDTRIRELTGEQRSLDDFARDFFGGDDGVWITSTYTAADIFQALARIAPFDWAGFFAEKLHQTTPRAPLDGLERGGYRLVYRTEPSEYQLGKEAVFGSLNLLFSIGLSVSKDGEIGEVLWESPAFDGMLTVGSKILEVDGQAFDPDALKLAVGGGNALELQVQAGNHCRSVSIANPGHRYPHLEPIQGATLRLDEILHPLGS